MSSLLGRATDLGPFLLTVLGQSESTPVTCLAIFSDGRFASARRAASTAHPYIS